MEPRRRTLASEGPLGNALQSSLPIPSSAVKKGTSRVSAIPPAFGGHGASQSRLIATSTGPGSLQHTVIEGITAQNARRSTILMQRGVEQRDLPASASRNERAGKTPQTIRSIPSSVRRSSTYASAGPGRPSLAQPPYLSSIVKDSRPIRDKGFQANCVRNVADYLQSVRCPTPISSKTLISPTAKEFQSIFRFLVTDLIDPGMVWGKKFEDDVLSTLRDLRYAGLDAVSRTAITAPGAPQAWPGLLAMLNWLVELCKAHDFWEEEGCSADPFLTKAQDLPPDHLHYEERLLWDFSSQTYSEWFDGGAEDFSRAEKELADLYESMASKSIEECEHIETTVKRRNVELQQLQAQEPPLKKLENEYVQLMGDKTKFIAFIELHKQKAERTKQAIGKFRAVISGQDEDLAICRAELGRVEEAVAAQNLAPDEVNRMNHERESLSRNLEDLRSKIGEASQTAYDHELSVTKSMDRFESLLAEYTLLGHQIGLIRATADFMSPTFDDTVYTIDLDLGAEDLDEIRATGNRMRSKIWQGLQAHRETYRLQAQRIRNDIIALEDKSDRAEQTVERQAGEASNLEARLRVVHEQAEEAQNLLATENANNNKIIAQLESEVTSMMAQSQQSVLSTQSQLESTRIAFKELRHRTALLQDAVVAEVGSHIDTVIKAKEHAANSLRSIRTLAETQ